MADRLQWRRHPFAPPCAKLHRPLATHTSRALYTVISSQRMCCFKTTATSLCVTLALPANGEWFQGLWVLAMQLLDLKPEHSPSMIVALLADFFTSDKYALDVNSTPTDRKFRTLNSHLDALRHNHTQLPAPLVHIQTEQTALAAFFAQKVPMHKQLPAANCQQLVS